MFLDLPTVTITGTASAPLAPTATFDPVINYPAFFSCLMIFSIYACLQVRIFGVENAAKRRRVALQSLRRVKALQLSSSEGTTEEEINNALQEFEQAMEDEEQMRTIIPGVRIIAPSSSKDTIAAAKQFLGKSLESQQDDETSRPQLTPTANSSSGIVILGVISICLIALLIMLSFDPLIASDAYLR